MLVRRLYSSASSHPAPSALAHIPAPRPHTRGRIRPRLALPKAKKQASTTAASASLAKPLRPVDAAGKGRKPRYSSTYPHSETAHTHAQASSYPTVPEPPSSSIPRTPRLHFTHPVPALNHTNEFRPIYLYPEQFKLYHAFTHPAHPLPLHLGTKIYTSPTFTSRPDGTGDDLFAEPVMKTPSSTVEGEGVNALTEHLRVVSSQPILLNNAEMEHQLFGTPEMEFSSISALLENKSASLKARNEQEWREVLAMMEHKGESLAVEKDNVQAGGSKDADLNQVVSELAGVLARLETDEKNVSMDSVKRKRRKKISKHKHKKRRKATRALRKRLGK
ncbi:hypothetical protein CNB00240 [Cryptococcus deneoformans JEC21]|uniref:Small ribosomal subunit protein mS38 n=1 Tax=Cryptococcus deneoformans (strain JEC21 / ATCC MYA-565) TaxID=214684 RepID=Q5KMW8_CRYD1|nr:hypothetical protein CNB00240 [Cryptococcus neoformans var. neoformans JEC21]AAW41458.1 hypothetical protein CNB00240 [Cryptococcus neoformans var. neoformans JEC21]